MKLSPDAVDKKSARIWFEKHYEPKESGSVPKPETPAVSEKKGENDISCRELYFRYERKETDILRGCSGVFAAGQVNGLAGGNGSGKTTLLRIMAGQFRPYHGKMVTTGSVSYLPQDPSYLFLRESVAEEYADLTEVGKSIYERMELSGLKERHPMDLSGGEKQRLALSIVLGKEADRYLLDEPTVGMDARAKRVLGECLHSLAGQGKTVILVSHDMEFHARYADMLSLMFQGEILLQTDVRSFFEDNQFYTTGINRVCRGVSSHIITIEDVEKYAKKKD
jgi:energy-coupling factor transport system ATP-binding protein